MDTMFLRDWTPLLSMPFDFVYRWSSLKNMNTAVLRIQTDSWLRSYLYATNDSFYPLILSKHCLKSLQCQRDLYILPNSFFDTWWMWMDRKCSNDLLPYPFIDHSTKSYFESVLLWWKKLKKERFSGFFTISCPRISKDILNGKQLYEWLFGGSFSYHWHGQMHAWNRNSCASKILDEFLVCTRELT